VVLTVEQYSDYFVVEEALVLLSLGLFRKACLLVDEQDLPEVV